MARAYYELVIIGEEKVTEAYVRGFLYGRGMSEEVLFAREHGFSRHHLKSLITHRDYLHLVCSASVRGTLASAVRRAPRDMEMELVSERKISKAWFHFKFDTFSRKVAGQLKRIFSSPPPGVRIPYYEPQELVQPDAKGVEGYAPMHEYHFFGEGSAEGDVHSLAGFYRKLEGNEFVEVEDVNLDF